MTLFARREAKTRIRQGDWLTLVGEKIRHEQVGTVRDGYWLQIINDCKTMLESLGDSYHRTLNSLWLGAMVMSMLH